MLTEKVGPFVLHNWLFFAGYWAATIVQNVAAEEYGMAVAYGLAIIVLLMWVKRKQAEAKAKRS